MKREDSRTTMSFHINEDLKRAVKITACKEDKTITEVITDFLKEYVKDEQI